MSKDDELVLELEIKDYKQQIEQIDLLISKNDNSNDKEEFETLKTELEQLVKLSEESLLEIKKQNLLLEINKIDAKNEEDENELEFIGSKCRVFYDCKKTGIKMHNAIVLGIDSEVDDTVRVLFCNPTEYSMKICDHFMQNNCKFDSKCKYSHGFKVKINDLHTYLEPNFENLNKGVLCLARNVNDLWNLGEIQAHDDNFIYVQLKMFNQLSKLEWHDVLILDLPENEYLSDKSYSEISDNDDSEISENDDSVIVKPNDEIAGWEKYTKGIGSKLLIKMGYVFGKGLGKSGKGRIEPVEVTVLPEGVSLDRAFEIKKKRKQKKKDKKEKEKEKLNQEPDLNVFEFINSKLTQELNPEFVQTHTKKEISKANTKNLNIKILDMHNKIKDEEKRNLKLKESLARNSKNDKNTLDQIKIKIFESDKILDGLRKSESDILEEKNNRKKKSDLF